MSLRKMAFKKQLSAQPSAGVHHGHYFFNEATNHNLRLSSSKLPDPSGTKDFLTQHEVVEAIAKCEEGALLIKVKSYSKLLPRFVQLYNSDGVLRVQSKRGVLVTKDWVEYNISSIHDIRIGRKSNLFLQCRSDSSEFDALYPDSRCFSVVFHSGNSLDFVAPSELSARIWQIALSFVVADYHTRDRNDGLERWLLRNFRLSDANRDGLIDFTECRQLLQLINLTMPIQQAKSTFDECFSDDNKNSTDGSDKRLNQAGFMRFYRKISERPELVNLFTEYSTGGDFFDSTKCMTRENLLEFMQKSQKRANFTVDQCQQLINRHEHNDTRRRQGLLSYDGFKSLLFGADQMLIKPETAGVYHDMSSFPLVDYFIASSHNTYLMGNQLTSLSSTDGYAQTLKLGCRCVELDIFDGLGESNEPVIYHKYTITNALRLSNVLNVIKEYAFVTSEYPLILSFESHVENLEHQRTMARMIREIFGDMLLSPVNYQEQARLPAPSEIKRKIIIKHKRLPLAAKGDEDVISNDEYDDYEADINDVGMRQLVAGSVKVQADATIKAVLEAKRRHKMRGRKLRTQPSTTAQETKSAIRLARELSDLVVYCVPRKFTSPLSDCAKLAQWYEIMAIAEPHGLQLLKTDAFMFAELAKKVMFRMYPGNFRFNSSNYDPCPFWQYGAQIVALNYQCLDEGLLVSIGRFLDNGNCGYVLKPDYLRSSASPDFTRERLDPARRKPIRVNIRLISGQQLPRAYATHTLNGVCVADDDDIPDSYVKIHVFGHELDRHEWQSKVIYDNGFSPHWNEEVSLNILFPELTVILFEVKDYDDNSFDDLIGWKALPLGCMQQGYRHVGLISPTLEPMPLSTLFVKVDIDDETNASAEHCAAQANRHSSNSIMNGDTPSNIKS